MKKLLLAFLLITEFCYADTPILTATFAKQKVEKMQLDNGLNAILVSDPNLEQSGALLTVQAGSWDEPADYPGIAHFLEHMLFLGTKKYPTEGEYQRYISHNNGIANAFTTGTYTAYLFSVDNNAFPEALDRFSEFFKEPLFNQSGVDRELQAIEHEYAKNLEDDDVRVYFVEKELSHDTHPDHRFSIGNRSTLSAVSQQTLKDWYAKNYSANLMRLIVYSTLPMEKLKETVVSDFDSVPNNQKTASAFPDFMLPDSLHGKMVYVQPVKNLRELTLIWEVPASFAAMRDSKPDSLIGYILGHEGKESLLAQLKREKLADGIKAGSYNRGNTTLLMELQVSLTDEGVSHVYDVITRIFQTLALLREKGIPKPLFDEVQQLAKIEYQYQQRKSLFEALMLDAYYFPFYDIASYPENVHIIQKYDETAIKDMIQLLTPQNCFFFLAAPTAITTVAPDKKEKWLGVPYAIRPIPEKELKSWEEISATHPKIALPSPNSFIPKNLQLLHETLPADQLALVPTPKKLISNENGTLYYAPDQRFGTPTVSCYFEIQTPQVDSSKPTKVVLADLFVKAMEESMNKISYMAEMAGLSYEISRTDYGIEISINGYSEHAPKLFTEILRRMNELHPTEDKFDLYKQVLQREYQNQLKELPFKQALEILKSAIYKDYSTARQKNAAIRRITYDKFNQYLSNIFTQTYTQAITYGNLTEENATTFWNELQKILGNKHTTPRIQKAIQLPDDDGPFYVENSTKSQGNAIILAIEGNGFSFEKRAAQQILGQTIEEPFFTELRTRQQTGYIVYSWFQEIELELFQFLASQSSTHEPQELRARFELFLENFSQELQHNIDENTFNNIKQTIATQLETPEKNVKDMAELLQKLAFQYDGNFNLINQQINGTKKLTYDKFITLSKELLSKNNTRKLAILLKSTTPEQTPQYQRLGSIQQLKKISAFPNLTATK